MEELNMEIYSCKKCRLWQGAKHGVPGEGPLNAKVMIVGQNPGADEDELGKTICWQSRKISNQNSCRIRDKTRRSLHNKHRQAYFSKKPKTLRRRSTEHACRT